MTAQQSPLSALTLNRVAFVVSRPSISRCARSERSGCVGSCSGIDDLPYLRRQVSGASPVRRYLAKRGALQVAEGMTHRHTGPLARVRFVLAETPRCGNVALSEPVRVLR